MEKKDQVRSGWGENRVTSWGCCNVRRAVLLSSRGAQYGTFLAKSEETRPILGRHIPTKVAYLPTYSVLKGQGTYVGT